MAFSKYSMLVLLTVAFIAFLWRFGRVVFTGITKRILWALAALCACAGLVAVLSSEGQPLPSRTCKIHVAPLIASALGS